MPARLELGQDWEGGDSDALLLLTCCLVSPVVDFSFVFFFLCGSRRNATLEGMEGEKGADQSTDRQLLKGTDASQGSRGGEEQERERRSK